MIVTLTPNPALDRTVPVDRLQPGAVQRTATASVEAGGKGINVARALIANGRPARAVTLASGRPGAEFPSLVEGYGIPLEVVATGQPVRTNLTVIEDDGRTTKLNEPGPTVTVDLAEALVDRTVTVALEAAAAADLGPGPWVAASGSLPPGAPADLYARLAERLATAGLPLAVDTSGPALAAAVDRPVALLKPNHDELAELTGRAIERVADAVDAARSLVERGVGTVLASLGAQGALLVAADLVLHGSAPVERVRNTVGAGDALLAGYLFRDASPRERLAEALAWARAAVSGAGTGVGVIGRRERRGVTLVDLGADGERLQLALGRTA